MRLDQVWGMQAIVALRLQRFCGLGNHRCTACSTVHTVGCRARIDIALDSGQCRIAVAGSRDLSASVLHHNKHFPFEQPDSALLCSYVTCMARHKDAARRQASSDQRQDDDPHRCVSVPEGL